MSIGRVCIKVWTKERELKIKTRECWKVINKKLQAVNTRECWNVGLGKKLQAINKKKKNEFLKKLGMHQSAGLIFIFRVRYYRLSHMIKKSFIS